MKPPFIARALVAATTSPADYESVSGDLHEEYLLRARSYGHASADRWYFWQAARSIPALLSYSRVHQSWTMSMATAIVVVAVLLSMLIFKDFIDTSIGALLPHAGLPEWSYFFVDWLDAAVFGAVLAAIVRSHGLRLTFIASVALVAAFALPVAFGFSPMLRPLAWLLLLGAVPAMGAGAAAYQIFKRR